MQIKTHTERLKFNHDRANELKNLNGMTLQNLTDILGIRAQNYFGEHSTMKAITIERAQALAQAFSCDVTEFTDGKFHDKRIVAEKSREADKRKRKENKQRMKEAVKVVSVVPREEVLPNGVIFIYAPFMKTWKSSMKPSEQPNCVYMRDHGIKRKIIEKQKVCTILYLNEYQPIEDIREAFRELRGIL